MTISNEVQIPVCENCALWEPDKYNVYMACGLNKIPCGKFYSCAKHQWDGLAKQKLAKSYKEISYNVD